MATNATDEVTEEQLTDTTDVEAELRQAKAEAKDKPEAQETAQDTQSTETAEAEEQSDATLTSEATSEPEKDLDWYKKAYEESTKEALRLKGELDKKVEAPPVTPVIEEDNLTPEQMYLRTKIAEETQEAFKPYLEKYPQLKEDSSYKEFVAESELLGKVFVDKYKRLPTPNELYAKTVASLGWTADNSEQLSSAIKDSAASPRTSSGTPSLPPKSKVTEEMIEINQKMYPNKSRQEIIEELEPHIQ